MDQSAREKLLSEAYEELHASLSLILYEEDPLGAGSSVGSPNDEYEGEAARLLGLSAIDQAGPRAVFDHVAINVSDMDASRRFFEATLAPLGYEISFESPEWVGMRAAARNDFGLVRRDPVGPTVHLGFEAPDRPTVDAFHSAALAVGGRDNGAPGLRSDYGDAYYAAFVIGPDGHNLEAVTQTAE